MLSLVELLQHSKKTLFLDMVPFNTWLISSWEENKCCYWSYPIHSVIWLSMSTLKKKKKRLSPSKRERLLSSCLFVAKIQFDTLLSLLVPHLLGYDIYQPYYHITLPQVFWQFFSNHKSVHKTKKKYSPIYVHLIFAIIQVDELDL